MPGMSTMMDKNLAQPVSDSPDLITRAATIPYHGTTAHLNATTALVLTLATIT